MTESEYLQSVRRKLNEGDPSLEDAYSREAEEHILSLRESAYVRTLLKLQALTGAPVKESSPQCAEASGFAPSGSGGTKPFRFTLPDDFLRLVELQASPWTVPLAAFSTEEALPVEADPWSRSGKGHPVAVKSGSTVYLFGDADGSGVRLTYIPRPSYTGEEKEDGVRQARIQEAICYYAASLVRSAQGGDGTELLARSEELL